VLLLDGKKVAAHRKKQLTESVLAWKKESGQPPCLAVVLVGEDPASQVYVGHKIKACDQVGIRSEKKLLPQSATTADVIEVVQGLNSDQGIHGILVQLPLPPEVDKIQVLEAIAPSKDADGLHPFNQGKLFQGDSGVLPCTPSGIINLLKANDIDLEGKDALVIGRSEIVGKPMAQLLLKENATVTVAHSRTQNLIEKIKRAQVVIVAAGQPGFLGPDDFAANAVIVDVGIHRGANGKLCGDVRFNEFTDFNGALTPVPGGVGPMTIVTLLENTLYLAKKQVSS